MHAIKLICSKVRIAAMEAFASFFRSIQKKSQKKYYGAVAEILNILPPLKADGDSENLTKALIALIELAEVAPTMFKTLFHSLVQFSMTVIQDKDLGDQARQNALELMATFADYNTAMCKKDPSYTSDMVTQCLSLMTDIGQDDDDAAEWNATEDVSTARLSLADKLTVNSWMPRKAISTMWLESSVWIGLRTSLAGRPFYHRRSTGYRE